MDDIKKFRLTPSGRKSALFGAKHSRGFIIRPEQILALFHDTMETLPIPKDAEFCGVGIDDAGINSMLKFYYTSLLNPHEHCFQLKPDLFLKYLVELGQGLLPTDSQLDGIEVSQKFTVLLLRVSSERWPPAVKDDLLPLVHLRYDLGQLVLCDASKAIEGERRIRIQ